MSGAQSTPQPVVSPLTRAAIFLTLVIDPAPEATAVIRGVCADLSAILRAVEFRDLDAGLTCVMGIGSDAWDRLFHIRANRADMCFEVASQIMERIGSAASTADEVHGFRYFDDRDLMGFVDGTENPRDQEAIDAALITSEDPGFTGGSYVIVQKYLHDMGRWNALPTEMQERIIGRTNLTNVELDDAVKPTSAHNALTTIIENGEERAIVRDNMPFGHPGQQEFGTYFIGYCRSPHVTEQMLENMFIGRPPGNYDRLLDFSRPVTGNLFFVPSATFLDAANDVPDAAAPSGSIVAKPANPETVSDGSLRIGSLKGDSRHE
jgi:putative iron-dependent peroxidase